MTRGTQKKFIGRKLSGNPARKIRKIVFQNFCIRFRKTALFIIFCTIDLFVDKEWEWENLENNFYIVHEIKMYFRESYGKIVEGNKTSFPPTYYIIENEIVYIPFNSYVLFFAFMNLIFLSVLYNFIIDSSKRFQQFI